MAPSEPFAQALDFLMPRRCPFCRRLVPSHLPCPRCQEALPWLVGPQAEREGEFLLRYAAALRYQGEVAEAVRAAKFHRKVSYLTTLGLLTAQCAQDHFSGQFDLITWVPLSPEGLRRRGFDQSRLLARAVAGAFPGVPLRPLFAKRSGIPRQSGLRELALRRGNVLGAFTLLSPHGVAGLRVLIVDDVITTGSTLSECARLLLLAGAQPPMGVAPARGGLRTAPPFRPGPA